MKTILHALSAGNIEVENSRRLADLKQLDATRIFLKKMDTKVYNGEHVVPIRLYFPTENAMSAGIEEGSTFPDGNILQHKKQTAFRAENARAVFFVPEKI